MHAPQTTASRDTASMAQIEAGYLLVTFVPYYVDEAGDVWVESGWHRDLVLHTLYLRDLTLFAPQLPWQAGVANLQRLDGDIRAKIRLAAMPPRPSLAKALWNAPKTARIAWREIRRAKVVHSGVVGWPFPIGWIVNPLALMQKRCLVLIVESATWRVPPGVQRSMKQRLMGWACETLARFFARRADMVVATQQMYLTSLQGSHPRGVGLVNPACWIDEGDVIDEQVALAGWAEKARGGQPLRMLFAGRLVEEKGVRVLLAAVGEWIERGVPVRVDIMGSGPLLAECQEAAAASAGLLEVRAPIEYGAGFFAKLREYECVLVPSLSDEQPRILFDAFSQAVPVLGSRTPGVLEHVTEATGWTCAPGDAGGLAAAVERIVGDRAELVRRGMQGRRVVMGRTHREMHRTRAAALARMLEGRG